MEHLYIVIYRVSPQEPWIARERACFAEKRLAENFAEILRLQDTAPKYEFAVVDALITNPAEMAEQEAKLGEV